MEPILRDRFAMAAIQALKIDLGTLLEAKNHSQGHSLSPEEKAARIAEAAFLIADALMAKR